MTLYLSILFYIFVMASFYKNKSSISTRFLCGIFLGWIMAIVCLVLYLSKQSFYWQEVSKIFYITPFMWNMLITRINVNPEIFIRGINIGILLFYYCALCFGIAFANKKSKQNNRKYLLLLIVSLLQIIFFDPSIQKFLQSLVSTNPNIDFIKYNNLCESIIFISKSINLLYCITMVIIMANYYITHPKIKFLKIYTLFNIICIFPVVIMFCYTFKWYPVILIKTTMKKGYYNYLVPDFQIDVLNNGIYYLIFLIAYTAIAFYMYKYSTMESYYKRDNVNINISMNTANLGINTFTHAIKNHIVGIKSEAEYLSKKYITDEEITTSTKIILESCEACFSGLENANKQLKNVTLNLKLIPIYQPISNALNILKDNKTKITYTQGNRNTVAYIDETAFTEVILNLITNAKEAIADKPNGEIKIDIKEQGGWGIIEIEDNGLGIEQENLNKIFIPFFSTKCSVNNWGVGLAFCYKVVNAHDGKITVESEVGKGTVFCISLPII